MGWLYYKDAKKKVGCSLRVSSLSDDITGEAPEGNVVTDVRVVSRGTKRRPYAVLQVWSYPRGKFDDQRFTVDVICVTEDPTWIVRL